MIDLLKIVIGLMVMAFLTPNLVFCQHNILAKQVITETPPNELSTTTSPSPSSEENTGIVGQWQRLDTTGGGSQTGIVAHPTNPEVVYKASDNGRLFKTEDGGDSWFLVSFNLGAYRLSSVTLDPLNPDTGSKCQEASKSGNLRVS